MAAAAAAAAEKRYTSRSMITAPHTHTPSMEHTLPAPRARCDTRNIYRECWAQTAPLGERANKNVQFRREHRVLLHGAGAGLTKAGRGNRWPARPLARGG